ncbi:hypothetical protein HRbin36_02505 [bacterium HR36]|nr:hypothetical protein HRbin36_02505 [bacterium HR36]
MAHPSRDEASGAFVTRMDAAVHDGSRNSWLRARREAQAQLALLLVGNWETI